MTVVHVVDEVLLPPSASKDIVEIAEANTAFSTLVGLLDITGLDLVLEGPGPFTVFAPTNAAFSALPAGTLESLSVTEASNILKYHVVPGIVLSTKLANGTATTVQGSTVDVKVLEAGAFINNAKVVTPDILAKNGVIHVINSVLLPNAAGGAPATTGSGTNTGGTVTTISIPGPGNNENETGMGGMTQNEDEDEDEEENEVEAGGEPFANAVPFYQQNGQTVAGGAAGEDEDEDENENEMENEEVEEEENEEEMEAGGEPFANAVPYYQQNPPNTVQGTGVIQNAAEEEDEDENDKDDKDKDKNKDKDDEDDEEGVAAAAAEPSTPCPVGQAAIQKADGTWLCAENSGN